jgi:hypothetical protein
VVDFLFSDVHCPLAISFSCNSVKDKTNPESIENNGVARIRKWDALWFLPEFEPRVFLADVIKILHKFPVNESIIFGLILSCGSRPKKL